MNQITDAAAMPEQEDFLKILRASTDVLHKRLEATPLSVKLQQQDVTLGTYAAYLMRMCNVVAHCENVIFPLVAGLLPGIDSRRKLPLIQADIDVLQLAGATPKAGPFTVTTPDNNIAFALGYMYVVEGSTLGGRILLGHISKTLGFDEHRGASFFAGYGADTSRQWKEFISVLCSYAATDSDHAADIITGSQYAFASIENYLG